MGFAFAAASWWEAEEKLPPRKPAPRVVVAPDVSATLLEDWFEVGSGAEPAPKYPHIDIVFHYEGIDPSHHSITYAQLKQHSASNLRFVASPSRADAIVPPELEYAAMAFTPDPFGDWICAHRDELARYVGQFVAIDPSEGIVGVGDDPVALANEHRLWDRLMITFVAPGMYAPIPAP